MPPFGRVHLSKYTGHVVHRFTGSPVFLPRQTTPFDFFWKCTFFTYFCDFYRHFRILNPRWTWLTLNARRATPFRNCVEVVLAPMDSHFILTREMAIHRGEAGGFFHHRFRPSLGGVLLITCGLTRAAPNRMPPAASHKTARDMRTLARRLSQFGLECDA